MVADQHHSKLEALKLAHSVVLWQDHSADILVLIASQAFLTGIDSSYAYCYELVEQDLQLIYGNRPEGLNSTDILPMYIS